MIRTALVGYGYAGKTIHAPLIRAAKGLSLAAIVSSRPEAVHSDYPEMTAAPTLEAALADSTIDLVVIATPNDLHAPQAHLALDAGKHVVIDKPFCVAEAEGEALIDHAARAGRLLSVFHCRRWDSNHLSFQAARPRLGEISEFVLHYDRWRPEVRNRWRENAGPGSGIWYDLGSHLIDQSLDLFGPPDWISADIQAQRPGARTDDYFHATLAYDRMRVILHASMLSLHAGPAMSAQGALALFVKLDMDTQEAMLKAGQMPGGEGWGRSLPAMLYPASGGEPENLPSVPGNYLAYYQGVAAAIRGDGPNPVPATEALAVMKIIEAGFESTRQGRRISF